MNDRYYHVMKWHNIKVVGCGNNLEWYVLWPTWVKLRHPPALVKVQYWEKEAERFKIYFIYYFMNALKFWSLSWKYLPFFNVLQDKSGPQLNSFCEIATLIFRSNFKGFTSSHDSIFDEWDQGWPCKGYL